MFLCKVKEKHYTINDKVDSNEDSESTSVENGTPEHHNNAHLHVEFTEPQVILVDTSEEIKDIPKLSVKVHSNCIFYTFILLGLLRIL